MHYLFDLSSVNNPIDRAWTRFVVPRRISQLKTAALQKWIRSLESAILLYSDTQIITGMAILLSGYIQLFRNLSEYHWMITVELAWFSSLTHLATLTSLRRHFRARPLMASCRIVLMGIVILLLIVALGSTGWISQGSETMTPAYLLFNHPQHFGPEKFNVVFVVLSVAFLLTAYVTRIIRLFNPLSILAEKWLRTKPLDIMHLIRQYLKKKLDNHLNFFEKAAWTSLQGSLVLAYVLLSAIYNIAGSMLWEVRICTATCSEKALIFLYFR